MKYEKWSIGYWLLKEYIRFADWLIHKKIIIRGKEHIPHHKPLVFAPNHQNALSDPMAVLLNTKYQPVWLARADIFGKSKITDFILKFLKIMPVYRLRDGKENLEKNEQTFEHSIRVLENDFALALFPEAAHSGKRQMLAHKKAVPRIVFMAEERTGNQLDIQIVPTGIYYSHYWKFNRTVIVHFGKPIPVKDFLQAYDQNPSAAFIDLKNRIRESILPLVIDIQSKTFYEEFESIRTIYGRYYLKQQHKRTTHLNRFYSDQKLVRKLDELEARDPKAAKDLADLARNYSRSIEQHHLRPWLISRRKKHLPPAILSTILLLVTLPVFLYGFLLNAIPFFLIDKVVRQKVKDPTFWSTFFLIGGIVLFPLFYLIELFAVAWLLPGAWAWLIFLISLPFAGKLAFQWYRVFRKTQGRYRILRLKWVKPNVYQHLLQEKGHLFRMLNRWIHQHKV